jgi:hypothetical protein
MSWTVVWVPPSTTSIAGAEPRRSEDRAQVREVRLHTGETRSRQRAVERRDRGRTVLAERDDLGEERVVVRRDLRPGLDPPVDAHALAERDLGEHAGAGLIVLRRVLGVDPHLDRRAPPRRRSRRAAPGQDRRLAAARRRLEDHPLDEVEPGDCFGHAVLDLEARVDLEEVEIVGRRVEDELDGAGGEVPDGAAHLHRGLEEALAHGARDPRRRRLLHHLLIAALRRAVALAEDHDLAPDAEDLHLDVTCPLHELLEVRPGVAEVGAPQALHRLERGAELLGAAADLQADAAAAGGALQDDRIPYLRGAPPRGGRAVEERRPGEERNPLRGRDLPGAVLETELTDLVRRRPDEADPRALARGREVVALAQESIAWVDRLGPEPLRHIEDAVGAEVAVRRPHSAEGNSLVGLARVAGEGVDLGVDRHAGDTHGTQRPQDAAGDLAAIGDKDFAEHGRPVPSADFVPDQNGDGRRIVSVAGVVELGAVRDEHEDVRFGAELDVFSTARDAVGKREAAGRRDRDVHEEVDVGTDVALREGNP